MLVQPESGSDGVWCAATARCIAESAKAGLVPLEKAAEAALVLREVCGSKPAFREAAEAAAMSLEAAQDQDGLRTALADLAGLRTEL